jgi:serine protease inhibitor
VVFFVLFQVLSQVIDSECEQSNLAFSAASVSGAFAVLGKKLLFFF